MHQSKLILLLKGLSPEDWRRLKKMLQSSFFTTNAHLLKFYGILKQYSPKMDSPKLAKEKLFKRIFSTQAQYDGQKLRALMREFTQLIEDYLLFKELQTSNYERRKRLVKIYGKQNYYPLFERGIRALKQELESASWRDEEYYREISDLNFEFYFHQLTLKYTLQDNVLSELLESIEKQAVLAKLRIGSELKSREQTLNKSYNFQFLQAVLIENEEKGLKGNPAFELYKLLFELYDTGGAETVFHQLKAYLIENIESIRRIEQALF